MTYINTERGQIWENPPPVVTHKTENLNVTEFRAVFTDNENIILDKAIAKIDDDLTWLPQNAGLIDSDAAEIDKPGFTYRDVLRSSFSRFKDAPVYSMNNPDLVAGLQLNAFFGLLDSPARVAVILQGLQINVA